MHDTMEAWHRFHAAQQKGNICLIKSSGGQEIPHERHNHKGLGRLGGMRVAAERR